MGFCSEKISSQTTSTKVPCVAEVVGVGAYEILRRLCAGHTMAA